MDDKKACVPEITWTNCADEMPPDNETEIIIRHVEDKEPILTPANEVFYDIDTLYKEYWEWIEFTPEKWGEFQTLPIGYTSCLSGKGERFKCIGNGWTVDVVAHIFKGLLNENI